MSEPKPTSFLATAGILGAMFGLGYLWRKTLTELKLELESSKSVKVRVEFDTKSVWRQDDSSSGLKESADWAAIQQTIVTQVKQLQEQHANTNNIVFEMPHDLPQAVAMLYGSLMPGHWSVSFNGGKRQIPARRLEEELREAKEPKIWYATIFEGLWNHEQTMRLHRNQNEEGKQESDAAPPPGLTIFQVKFGDGGNDENDGILKESQKAGEAASFSVAELCQYLLRSRVDDELDLMCIMGDLQKVCAKLAASRWATGNVLLQTDAPAWFAFMMGRAFPACRFTNLMIAQRFVAMDVFPNVLTTRCLFRLSN
jgi:hypothetical protein